MRFKPKFELPTMRCGHIADSTLDNKSVCGRCVGKSGYNVVKE